MAQVILKHPIVKLLLAYTVGRPSILHLSSLCSLFSHFYFLIWHYVHLALLLSLTPLRFYVPPAGRCILQDKSGVFLSPPLYVPKYVIYRWKAKGLVIPMMYANPGYNQNCGHSKHLCQTSRKYKKVSKSPIKPHSIRRKDTTPTKTVLLRWQGSSKCTPVK